MRSYRASLSRLGLPALRFHDLRHYCATEALSAGLPPHEVARYLGHASPAVTLTIYGHITPRGADLTADVFDRALGSGPVEIRP
jgi:integrase